MQKLLSSLSIKVFILTFFMSLSFSNAQGQIWNNIGSKVNEKLKRKADQKIEEKIDKAIDKGFDKTEDKIEESFQKEESDETSTQTEMAKGMDFSSLFGGAAEIRDEYKLDFGITYTTTSTNSKGKSQEIPNITMWMSESGITAIDVKEQNSTMILDMEKESMVIIQNDQKTYMAIKSNMKATAEKMMAENAENESDVPTDFKIEKIGSETLLGYNCDIYKITNDGQEATVWSTDDIKFDYSKMAGGFNNSFSKKQSVNIPNIAEMPTGMLLRMDSFDTKSNEKTSMIATEVFENGKTFSMSSYKKLGMQ